MKAKLCQGELIGCLCNSLRHSAQLAHARLMVYIEYIRYAYLHSLVGLLEALLGSTYLRRPESSPIFQMLLPLDEARLQQGGPVRRVIVWQLHGQSCVMCCASHATSTYIEITATLLQKHVLVDLSNLSQFFGRTEFDFGLCDGVHKGPHDVDKGSDYPRQVHEIAHS